jgi:hypothetical protein
METPRNTWSLEAEATDEGYNLLYSEENSAVAASVASDALADLDSLRRNPAFGPSPPINVFFWSHDASAPPTSSHRSFAAPENAALQAKPGKFSSPSAVSSQFSTGQIASRTGETSGIPAPSQTPPSDKACYESGISRNFSSSPADANVLRRMPLPPARISKGSPRSSGGGMPSPAQRDGSIRAQSGEATGICATKRGRCREAEQCRRERTKELLKQVRKHSAPQPDLIRALNYYEFSALLWHA